MRRGLVLGALAAAIARPSLLHLGATHDERRLPLPGDELVPRADVHSTMAIDIAAPPAAVWPWLVQMGCGRGGWYGIDLLDNGGRPSATRVHPEWQQLAPGDRVAMTPSGSRWFTVERADPRRALVLSWSGCAAGARVETSWALVLHGRDDGGTRLLARVRASGTPRPAVVVAARLLGEPGHVVVQRRQLLSLRRRACSGAGDGIPRDDPIQYPSPEHSVRPSNYQEARLSGS